MFMGLSEFAGAGDGVEPVRCGEAGASGVGGRGAGVFEGELFRGLCEGTC